MKCLKCGYLGFDIGDRCRNCGYDFSLVPEERPTVELSLNSTLEPLGPLADFSLASGAQKSTPAIATGPVLELHEGIGTPRPPAGASDLPLFADSQDQEPLITSLGAARPPLAVRRATPDVPRARASVPRPHTPELTLELESADASERAFADSLTGQDVDAAPIKRLIAAAIDLALLVSIDIVVVYFTLRLCGLTTAEPGLLPMAPLAAFFLLLNGGYSVAFTAVAGQTIGKMALGLRVVGPEQDAIDLGRAVVRTLSYVPAVLPLGLGLVPAVFGHGSRALHDRLADTRVIDVRAA